MSAGFFKPPSKEQVELRETFSVCIDEPDVLSNHYANASAHNANDAILIAAFHFLLDYVRHWAGYSNIERVELTKHEEGVFELNVASEHDQLKGVKLFIRDPKDDDAACHFPSR